MNGPQHESPRKPSRRKRRAYDRFATKGRERPSHSSLSIRTGRPIVVYEPLSQDELILRDHLALDRTRLANERTLLAYLRTSLMLLVAGATAVKLVDINTSILITGWVFLVLGIFTGVVGIWRFLAMRRAINSRDR